MHSTYFETAMAFLGLASIVAGSFAGQLEGHVLRDDTHTARGRTLRDFWSVNSSRE